MYVCTYTARVYIELDHGRVMTGRGAELYTLQASLIQLWPSGTRSASALHLSAAERPGGRAGGEPAERRWPSYEAVQCALTRTAPAPAPAPTPGHAAAITPAAPCRPFTMLAAQSVGRVKSSVAS